MRLINGKEPRLLDVLSIPLERTGPDLGFQPENRLLKQGKWRKVGTVTVADIEPWCEERDVLLHTESDRVSKRLIAGLRLDQRYSLQLIDVDDAGLYTTRGYRGGKQVRAEFSYAGTKYDIVVTDPLVEERVRDGDEVGCECILAVSMGGPWYGNYFKFVAGVIELWRASVESVETTIEANRNADDGGA